MDNLKNMRSLDASHILILGIFILGAM